MQKPPTIYNTLDELNDAIERGIQWVAEKEKEMDSYPKFERDYMRANIAWHHGKRRLEELYKQKAKKLRTRR